MNILVVTRLYNVKNLFEQRVGVSLKLSPVGAGSLALVVTIIVALHEAIGSGKDLSHSSLIDDLLRGTSGWCRTQ